jgi:hypothetical protein
MSAAVALDEARLHLLVIHEAGHTRDATPSRSHAPLGHDVLVTTRIEA